MAQSAANWNARQIWSEMSKPMRERVCLALWSDDQLDRQQRMMVLAPWLAARGFRAAYLEKLPKTRRAALMAEGGIPEETAGQLLLSYHLVHKRELLASFLNLLGIKQENGIIHEDEELEPPEPKRLAEAAQELLDSFEREDVELYFKTLLASDPHTWGGLAELAPLAE